MASSDGTEVTHSANYPRPGDDLDLLCPFPALDEDSRHRLQRIVRPVQRLRRREILYRVGTRFQVIYMVASGAIKSYRIAASHLPGIFLGCLALVGLLPL